MQFSKLQIVLLGVALCMPLVVSANATYQSIFQLDRTVARTGGGQFQLGVDGRGYGVSNNPLGIWSVKLDGTDFKVLANANSVNVNAGGSAISPRNSQGLLFKGAPPNTQNDVIQNACPYTYNVMPEGGGIGVPHYKYGFIYKFNAETQPEKLPVSESKPICPTGTIAIDNEDNLYFYSSLQGGGAADADKGDKLYKIAADGSSMTEIKSFSGAGENSVSPNNLFLSNNGQWLYGVTTGGGANNVGFIFKMKLDGSDYTVIYDADLAVGNWTSGQLASLIEVGNYLYGAFYTNGTTDTFDAGSLFRIKPDGTEFRKLYEFIYTSTTADANSTGSRPSQSMTLGGDGNIYGTANRGGAFNRGVIYRIKPSEISDTSSGFELLYSFTGDAAIDGQTPTGLYAAKNGLLYGIVGNANGGRVYQLDIGYVPQSPVFNSFSTNPTEVEWIGSAQAVATLTWDVSNASLCTASGAWTGTKATAGIEQVVPAQLGDNVYTLTCDNGSGLENAVSVQSVTVTAVEPVASSSSSSSAPASSSSEASVSSISSSEAISSSSSSSEVIASSSSSSEAIASSSSSSEIIASSSSSSAVVVSSSSSSEIGVNSSSSSAVVVSSSSSSEAIATSSSSSETIASSSASSEIVVSSSSTPVVIVSSSSTSSAPVSSSASSIPASSSSSSSVAVSSSSVAVSSSSIAVSSSSSSATVIESNKSGGGGAMNLWWMLSLCLLALGRCVKV